MKKILNFLPAAAALLLTACGGQQAQQQGLQLNDLEYFERQGVNVLVYSNDFNGGFNDEKNSGIELIHHGVRTVQGGAVRLNKTPEQWDLVPKTTSRTVNRDDNSIEVGLRYDDYDFDSRVVVTGKGDAVEIAVYLDQPLPEGLVGDAGFNLEFLPSQYWAKTYMMDGRLNRFPRITASETVTRPNQEKPRQFKGFKTYDDRGTDRFVDPLPLETGHCIVMAQDTPERMIKVTSQDAELQLYDGRVLAQNGWFVLRSELPKGKTGKVVTWTIEPNAIKGWVREPNIGFSQVGYLPEQPKVAVIELDKMDKPEKKASIHRIMPDGTGQLVYSGKVDEWGRYFKYNYVKFDFSSVQEPGVYYIQYGQTKTNNFLIDASVYDKITDATSDVWIPIHMNHMAVNEGYRLWHGEPFKDGYVQAPPSDHFDLHFQGPETETKYKPYQLIPGLNVGGFFDAGDYDIETGSNISVIQNLVLAWELFRSERDETFVDEYQRYVDLHRPDGKPDILQFIEHGTLNIVAQAEQIGHMASTLSNGVLDNYHHLGDISAITDGKTGTHDDMWAFTSPRKPQLDFRAATMLAAASRVLVGYNDALAQRALVQSKRLLKEASELMAKEGKGQSGERDSLAITGFGNMSTNLQLYASTHEQQYRDAFEEQIWKALERNVTYTISTALDAIPYMDDEYREKLRPYVAKYNEYIKGLENDNPYAVPIGLGNWAASPQVATFGTTICHASKYFPDLVDKNDAFKAAAYLYGCHPYHNYSLVATVGATRPKAVFYGNNRADFSFIPGNMAPGLLFRKPDHFENYDQWPFLWGQNEGTIAGNCAYLIFAQAFKSLAK